MLVEAVLAQGRPRFLVSDRGPGVPPDIKRRIFNKYATGDPGQGTGIGLAFCRMAAEALQGGIKLEDRSGGGSVFVLDLPAAAVPAAGGA